jgi:hypothetical protein
VKGPSLVSRLALLQMGLAAALLLAFSTSAILLSSRTLERQEGVFLTQTATQLSDALGDEWNEAHDLGRAAEVVLQDDVPPGLQVQILDEHMRPVSATDRPASRHPTGAMRSVRRHVARGAWIVVSVSTRPRQRAIGVLSLVLVVVGLSLFSLTAVLSRALAQRMLRPLRRMARRPARRTGAPSPRSRERTIPPSCVNSGPRSTCCCPAWTACSAAKDCSRRMRLMNCARRSRSSRVSSSTPCRSWPRPTRNARDWCVPPIRSER